jgi:hypothetical protein
MLPLACGVAHARANTDLAYSVAECFSTALRFVRIDRGCKVTDKDADAAFVTFECHDGEKVQRGSLEIFAVGSRSGEHAKESVRLQVTLGDEPHYAELRFLELLERKLRDERGTPPAVTPKHPADGGTAASRGTSPLEQGGP